MKMPVLERDINIHIKCRPETWARLESMMVDKSIKALTPYVIQLIMNDIEKWEQHRIDVKNGVSNG